MSKLMKSLIAAAMIAVSGAAVADPYDDGLSQSFYASLKGKKVGFVPIGLGFDLTDGWYAALQEQAHRFGYQIVLRDPNWNTEAGVQAITSLINENPDVLVIHNNDVNSYNRLVRQALDANIPVVQINQKVTTNSDFFVGPDWYAIGQTQGKAVIDACGVSKGKSGKIAFVGGQQTTPSNFILLQGLQDAVNATKGDVTIVASQSADWDATKAQAVTATILKQTPDLCGIVGPWDGQDIGTAAAIKDAGKQDQVFHVTGGGGRKESACDKIADGTYDAYVSYDVKGQGRDLNAAIQMLLTHRPAKAGETTYGIYSALTTITKANLTADMCWSLEGMKAAAGQK